MRKKFIGILCIFAAAVLAAVLVFKYLPIFYDYENSKELYSDLQNKYTEENNADQPTLDALLTGIEHRNKEFDPIDVDSEKLQDQNPDYIGWIYVPKTDISYPVVASADNSDYLHADFNRAYSFPGTIFMDCQDTKGILNHHTILYGLHIQMELADAVNNYFSILENLPEANSLQNVLTRYSKIILDNIEDQGSTSETVSAGAVQQDLTVSEGHITQKSAKSLLQAVLSTAKTDSELESIVENWTAIMNNPDYTYDAFVDSIAELEGALVDDDTDAAGLTLRAWTDDAGNVVGQQLLWKDGNIEQNFIKYLKTSAGTENGYLLKLADDEDGILLEGSGKIADDLLNGTYTLTMDGSEIAIIDVADYDTAAIKDGVWNGTYIISGSAYETEDGEETDTLNKMQLIFGSDGMDNKNLSVRCSLVNNGAYLGTLFFTSDMENGIESVDPASLNDV